jgi:hypothetical protein
MILVLGNEVGGMRLKCYRSQVRLDTNGTTSEPMDGIKSVVIENDAQDKPVGNISR